jgi:hypothetical protein
MPADDLCSTTSECAFHDRAKQFPVLPRESHHLHLLERRVVSRAGIDRDARQQHTEPKLVKVGRLLQHIFAREVVPALHEHLHQRLGGRVTRYREVVGLVAARIIPIHEGGPLLEGRVVIPGWIGRILGIASGENALSIGEPSRPEHRPDRARNVVEEVQWLPTDLSHLLDRLGGEFGGSDVKEDVSPRGLQAYDLGIGARVRGFIGALGDDRNLARKTIRQTFQIVFAEIIVLIQYSDFAFGMVVK